MFELNQETRWILGRPNFTLISHVRMLRLLGQEIPHKAEDEQAACIYWMLCLYEQHGENWRTEATKILKSAVHSAYRDAEGWVLSDGNGEPVNWPTHWPSEVDAEFLRKTGVKVVEG
jgi:hypothetical protein